MRHCVKNIHRLDLAADYINKLTLLFLLEALASLKVSLERQIWAILKPFQSVFEMASRGYSIAGKKESAWLVPGFGARKRLRLGLVSFQARFPRKILVKVGKNFFITIL